MVRLFRTTDTGYGPERLKPISGPSTWSQMRELLKDKPQQPVQKFAGVTEKVRLERAK